MCVSVCVFYTHSNDLGPGAASHCVPMLCVPNVFLSYYPNVYPTYYLEQRLTASQCLAHKYFVNERERYESKEKERAREKERERRERRDRERAQAEGICFSVFLFFEKERAHAGEKKSVKVVSRVIESKRTNSVRKRKCRERCYRA